MIIDQETFFDGLDFEECMFEYLTEKRVCYKGKDGGYYRVDHFGTSYVIEYAENEEEARLNCFEDADTFDDTVPENVLIKVIRRSLMEYVNDGDSIKDRIKKTAELNEDEYICNDIGVLEQLQMIRSMSDEEFEAYLEELSKKKNEPE